MIAPTDYAHVCQAQAVLWHQAMAEHPHKSPEYSHAAEQRTAFIRSYYDRNGNMQELATKLGISRQRLHQIATGVQK